ncbi:MAG: hypothetical protein U0W40_18470 [Acidimicrobiia bacterium]
MGLPDEVRSYHTAWVGVAGGHGDRHRVPVRYALAGQALVMFGDGGLTAVPHGTPVSVSIHEIHDGPPIVSFTATLHDVAPEDVDVDALAELLAHVSLGRDLGEVRQHLEEVRAQRRVVALVT